jgi:hypothetical protein
MKPSKYKNLEQIIRGKFNEDFEIWGDTFDNLVNSSKRKMPKNLIDEVILEIDNFQKDNSENLEQAFEREFGHQCDPDLWGHTTASFLKELKRLLQSH